MKKAMRIRPRVDAIDLTIEPCNQAHRMYDVSVLCSKKVIAGSIGEIVTAQTLKSDGDATLAMI